VALWVPVKYCDVRLCAVLVVVHQRISADLEKVSVYAVRRQKFVVDDAMGAGAPVIKNIVDISRDMNLIVLTQMKGHVDSASIVAEELVDHVARRDAVGKRVVDEVCELGKVIG